MAGALLGLVSGGALAFAGGKYREKLQREEQSRQFTAQTLMQGLQNNPKEWANPETQKQFKKHFGEESYNALKTHFDMALGQAQRDEQAYHAQVGQLIMGMAGGQGPQAPSGAPPATPSPSPAAGMLSASAPSAGAGPSPAPVPRPAASPGPAEPEAPVAPLDFSKQIDSLRRQQITASGNTDLSDEHKKAVGDFYDKLIKDKVEEARVAGKGTTTDAAVRTAAIAGARLPYEEALADYRLTIQSRLQDAKDEKAKQKVLLSTVTAKTRERPAVVKAANALPTQAEREAYINTFNSGLEDAATLFDDPNQQEKLRKLQIPLAGATPGRFYGETPGLAGDTGGSATKPTAAQFKTGDTRTKNGVTYRRDDKGVWTPVK